MVRIRHGWLVAALALGVSVGACKKDEKSAAGDTAAAKAGTAVSDLELLPMDSEMVLGINFAQVQKSGLWKQFVEPQLAGADAKAKLAKFKEQCGFDPMTAVTSVSVGLKSLSAKTPDGIVVAHGLNKGKVLGCIDKMKSEAEKDGVTITTEGDVVMMTGEGETVAVTFVNDSTLVAGVGANGNAASVKSAIAGGSALKSSPAFVDMHSKINTKDSLWLFMNGNAEPLQAAGALGLKPKAVFGSLNVTDGLTVDMRIRLDSADQAKQLATMAQGQLAMVQAMVDKIDVTSDGADVKVGVAISAQKLQGLSSQLGGMMGAFGGM